jgi:peptidoglycan/LPS O-acetylase OafA/YrhL
LLLSFLLLDAPWKIIDTLRAADAWSKICIGFANLFMLGTDWFWLFSFDPATSDFFYDAFRVSATNNGSSFLINPPVFSISIEIMFYLLAPFFVKSLKRSVLVLWIGIAYYVAVMVLGYVNRASVYHFFPSTLVYFASGAIMYQVYARKPMISTRGYAAVGTTVLAMACLPLVVFPVLLMAFALAVPFLFDTFRNSRVDRFIGELSYPVYLLHQVVIYFLEERGIAGHTLIFLTFGITLALAVTLYLLVERPIDKFRHARLASG